MSKRIALLCLLAVFCCPATYAATLQVSCSSVPMVDCDKDYGKADNCRNALGDSDMQKEINSGVCCTGASGAKVFKVPAVPTPPAVDNVCSDFEMKVSGKGKNKK